MVVRIVVFISLVVAFSSCHFSGSERKMNHFDSVVVASYKADSITASQIVGNDGNGIDPSAFATMYVIVTDTGMLYDPLNSKMKALHTELGMDIDMLGRSFDPKRNLIALPDTSADESYAGAYFPRRFPSYSLSIEYLDAFTSIAGVKTMAVVAGIYENKKKAEVELKNIRDKAPEAFCFPSLIYQGNIH